MVVQIHVTTFVLNSPHLTVRAAVSKDGVEYTSTSSSFTSGSSRLIQMKMPETAVAGNYTLHVDGSSNGGYGNYVFQNETQLMFNPKLVSVFISTDKRIYNKRKTIHFRVVALHPNLLPVMSGSIHIFVKDGAGHVVRRFLSQQISHGYYEGSFGTEHPCKYGWWSIVVQGWVSQALAANCRSINGQTTGRPVLGNATIELEIRPTGMTSNYPTIKKKIIQFTGRCPFQFTLAEMRQKVDRLTGAQLILSATVIDWYLIELKTEKAISYVFDGGIKVRFLGGRVRVFKPGNPLKAFIAVYGHDGSKFGHARYRQVAVQTIVRKMTGETKVAEEKKYIIPDDSIVKHSYTPGAEDEMITIRAAHEGVDLKYEEMTAWKHYTRRNEHIYVSMSTSQPVVDSYVVFTLRISTYVPHIYYMVVTGGNIITSNMIFMKFRQKTFSLAVSRDMVPNAKIVAYCVLNTGEILADSLAFFVKGIRNDGVRLNINRGKDFSGNTAEVNALADPASFIAFSATQYQVYKPGGNQFFREYDVEEDLSSYDDHTNNSFSHTWLYDEARKETVHYPASSYAVDANTTFTFAGLIVFTDAELRRMPAALECNITRGSLPCFDGTCYQVEQRCDDERQCEDGADELGCSDYREAVFRPVPYKLMPRLESHLDDSTWAWKNFYTKPYGRVDFHIKLPMRPLIWVIGAFSLHRERGLAFAEYPVRALLTLKGSKQYKFIKVTDGGFVSSYNPETTDGDVQTMVKLIPGESRFVHFPIVILDMGKVKVTVSAESPVNRQEVTKVVTIRYDGITNVYQTPYLIDLVSKGSVIIPSFQVVTPERFIYPEQRRHLYVPGSPEAKLTIVGDIVGPGFTTPRLDMYRLIRAIHGDGENHIFNFAINWCWLTYLKQINQLSTKLMREVLDGLNKGTLCWFALNEDIFRFMVS
ncbi:hypothetical protein LSAT2_013433 [Lamellibrachia satsuma]|nr:hypothetical protein LSAT2_013433 [Lamellibrachia satsuma]